MSARTKPPTAPQLRQLADAMDRLAAMKSFDFSAADPHKIGLGVSWSWGSSTSGYRELASGITEVVAGGMHVFRDEAIKRQQAKVDALLAELKTTLTHGATE